MEQFRLEVQDFSPRLIAESGQCFRMKSLPGCEKAYSVTAGQHHVEIRNVCEISGENICTMNFGCSRGEYEDVWHQYFDMDFSVKDAEKAVPTGDEYLQQAFERYKGLRILRQDKSEMLITFLISQRKSIPAISSCVEKLCGKYGQEISGEIYGFPSAEKLAEITEEQWTELGVGYRAPYLAAASRFLVENSLDDLDTLTTQQLLEKLMELKGVGIKVASCVALFGYHRLDTAPVDVWIKKVIDHRYGGVSPFPGYGTLAGLFQQYMFCFERELEKGR